MNAPRTFRSALVGRDQPLRELRDALATARGGRGQLVLLSGEPGIGKTRLAEEAEEIARADAVRVVWGRCHQIEGRPPFWPWVQILRAYALEVGPAEVAADVGADALPLAQLVPELHPHLQAKQPTATLDSESARFRLFLGLAALLRQAARARPLLLVLDDLHWADVTSLRLLEFLSFELNEMPIVAVGTYRDVDIQGTPGAAEIVASLARRARSIALSGFTRDEVARFVANASTQPLSEASTARLHEITDGNPFFLDEMVRLLDARGGELPTSGLPLTQGVLGTIQQRLAALSPDVVQLLAVGAVAGREFDIVGLEAVLDQPRIVLRQQLQPAVDCDVVRTVADRPGHLRFSHALIHDAIRAELPLPRRVELHRLFGEMLALRHAGTPDACLPEIAHHFFEAAMHGCEAKAFEFAERAGEHAMRVLAFEEAAMQFARALHLLELAPVNDPVRQCNLLLRLGEATNRAAQGPESVAAYERAAALARQIGSAAALARAAIGLCGVGATWAQYGRCDSALVAILREALDGLGDDEPGLRARVMARLATELHFAPTPVDTDALSAEAVAIARSTGDISTLAYTLPARLRCSNPDQGDERRIIIDEILALTAGRGELAVHAYVWKLSEALQAGAMADVDACRESLIAAVRDLRQQRDAWIIPLLHCQKHIHEGRIDEAERLVEGVLAQGGLTTNGQMAALVLLFGVRREQGRHGELAEGLRAFAYQSATVAAWRTNLAQLYAETGAEAAARAEVDALVDEGLSCLRRDNTWMLGAAGLAGAAAIVGRPEQAAIVYRALQPYEGRNVVAASFHYFGPVSYYLGLLALRQGHRDAALAHLDAAVTSARSVGALPYVARALMAHAAAWEMGPDADVGAALALRQEAAEIAATLGLQALATAVHHPPIGRAALVPELAEGKSASLRSSGAAWVLTYAGRTSILKRRKGLDYLARLLAAPGREFHVLDLATGGVAHAIPAGGDEVVLDTRAKRELQARLDELRAAQREAEANNDSGRVEEVQSEMEAISLHLARALGLAGRDRVSSGAAERARAAVTKALRAAIRQIEECEPDLAAVLERAVRTGAFCGYTSPAGVPIEWTIDAPDPG